MGLTRTGLPGRNLLRLMGIQPTTVDGLRMATAGTQL